MGLIAVLLGSCRSNLIYRTQSNENSEETLLVFYEAEASINVVMFQKEYPDYDVKFVPFGAFDDLENMIANEGEPDVILAGCNGEIKMKEWYENGFIKDMDDMFIQDATLKEEDYMKDTFQTGKIDGRLIGLPLTVEIPFYVVCDEFWYGSEFEDLPEEYTGRELYSVLLNEVKKEQSEDMFFLIHRADIYEMLTRIGIIKSKGNEQLGEKELISQLYQYAIEVSEEYDKAHKYYDTYQKKEFNVGIFNSAINPERFGGQFVISEYIGAPQIAVSHIVSANQAICGQNVHFLWIPNLDDGNKYTVDGKTWGYIGNTQKKEEAYELVRKMMDLPLDENLMQLENTYVSVNMEMAIKQLKDNNQKVGEINVYGEQGNYMYSIMKEELSDSMQDEIIEVLENVNEIYRETEIDFEAEYLQYEYIEEGKIYEYEGYYEELKKLIK